MIETTVRSEKFLKHKYDFLETEVINFPKKISMFYSQNYAL